jgi:hypothetical protein
MAKFHEKISWNSMEIEIFHEISWEKFLEKNPSNVYGEFHHEIPWNSMEFSNKFYGIPWNFMKLRFRQGSAE